MHPQPQWIRSIRLVILPLVLLLVGSALPASAQSPVAEQPPIKVVRLFERLCPANVDPSAGTWQDARTACPDVAEGMVFTLTSRDPAFPQIPLAVNARGETEWREVPSGVPYAIARADDIALGAPWVACRFASSLDPAVPDTERTFRAPSNTIEIGASEPVLATYLNVECYWFDIPRTAGVLAEPDPTLTPTPPAAEGSTTNAGVQAGPAASPDTSANAAPAGSGARVDIRGWQCPFHVDLTTASPAELQALCASPLRSIGYVLNGDPATRQAASDIGSTSYQDVPYGTLTIQQEAWGSYDPVRVFCYTQPFTAPHGPIQASQEIAFTTEPNDTFSVTLQVDPGEAVDCIWFDAHVTEDDLGSVLITAVVCPEGFDVEAAGVNDLLTTCRTPQANAYYELVSGAAISGGSTDANGFMGFINYTPQAYDLYQATPLGSATARVFCRSYNAADWNHAVEPYVEYSVYVNRLIGVQLTAHWELDCVWFDVAGIDYAYLDITAWSCPDAFAPDITTGRDTFASTCTSGVSGASFTATSGTTFEVSALSDAGYAFFQEKVPSGGFDIEEVSPAPYDLLRTFCGTAPFIGIGAIPSTWYASTEHRIGLSAAPNDQVVCEFYYVGGNTAAAANASPDTGETSDDVQAAASQDESADQEPAVPASPAPEPTTANEEEPVADSTSTPAIVPSQGQSAASSDSPTPPVAGDTATLLLQLHTCPPEYDVYTLGADPAVDCASSTDAPAMTVDGAASETSAAGVAGWTGLQPGVVQIEAAAGAFLGTCSSDLRTIASESVVTPFVFANPDGAIGIALLAGETLTCDWYTVADGESGTVSVSLLACPGPTVIEAQCTPAPGPALVRFEPVGGDGAAFDLQIADSGTGQASAAGSYQLVGFPDGTCSIASDGFDDTGALVIDPGASVEVRIYLCGA